MTTYLYSHIESQDPKGQQKAIEEYAASHQLGSTKFVEDTITTKTHWRERGVGSILESEAGHGDSLVVFEAAQLACSTSQIIEILGVAVRRNVHIHFVKYDMSLTNESEKVDTQHLLTLISRIESDFISKRTTQALARRRAAGLPLGRPKGRGNKSLKLDKHKSDIKKYLELGISKASIAKLVDCHPQTLYDWLDRNNLKERSASEDRETA